MFALDFFSLHFSSYFFPTCQVRVVRFYVCCPSFFFFLLLPSFFRLLRLVLADILAVLFARCRQMSTWTSRVQWAAPDLNSELQIAVGSAGPQPGSSGAGNAGPHPGSSGADWATPDLTRGPPERSGQCRTSAARRYVRRCVRNMSEKNVRKNVRRYVRTYIRQEC